MVPVWLLLIFITCAFISLLLCWVAKLLFPKFRRGEYKPGTNLSDLPPSEQEYQTTELPLVGGIAITLSIILIGVGAGYIFNLSPDQWRLLLIGLGATAGYMVVGFIDDWHKVHSNEGLSVRAKFSGVLFVSMAAAFLYWWLYPSGREAYSPYIDITGPLLQNPFIWLIFLMLLTGLIGSFMSLSVDSSDVLDGLAGGLVFSVSLAFGIIVTSFIDSKHPQGIVLEILSLLCAGSVFGFMPWNWPSAWTGRRDGAKRRAKISMGASGTLSLSAILVFMAIFSREEFLLLIVGSAFLLEVLTVFIWPRFIAPFSRLQLRLEVVRFVSGREYVPRPEFSQAFPATSFFHHLDLEGWERRRLVYGAWALGSSFALLGVMSVLAPPTWVRYLCRILVLLLLVTVWSIGPLTLRYRIRERSDKSSSYKAIPSQKKGEEQGKVQEQTRQGTATEVEDQNTPPVDVDLSQIFIGREQQLDQFRYYLERWMKLAAASSATPLAIVPSLNDKIQGMVVLVHGRGGFGKTMLLKHYYDMALEYEQVLGVGKIVDWEFAARDRQSIFHPAPGENVAALEYFRLLRDQLASALGKQPISFKGYQSAVNAILEARKQARIVLTDLKQENQFDWLRGPVGEGVVALLHLIPYSNVVLSNEKFAEKVKEVAGEGTIIGLDQLKQVWDRLHARLDIKLSDYLEPALRLGQGLGADLALFARRSPLLLFFDTYEVVDEADEYLRLVMGAAGTRVGWVLAGRNNLWAGLSQRLRSRETEYGYKDLVPPDRRLVVDFSAEGAGDFALGDIEEYFTQLCTSPRQPPLPVVTEKDAAHILEVTQGVPLAVKIAASLYFEKPDLKLIIEEEDNKREIVDQMVRRYLLHTRTNQSDRLKLYGLALLRRPEEPTSLAAALDLPQSSNYEAELSRLHRRYGFVFAKNEQPSLHQEVRHFLRLYLLEHRTNPEIMDVNRRIKAAHIDTLKKVEAQRQYMSLQERLEDERWVGLYLDLTEQEFWLDAAEGVQYALPFMMAAAIYRRYANREQVKLWQFFEPIMQQPYRRYWDWSTQSLVYSNSYNPLSEELTGLQSLVKLASERYLDFPRPVPAFREELQAALWWRLGEAYQGRNESDAQDWYEKARGKLSKETVLEEEIIETAQNVDYKLEEEK